MVTIYKNHHIKWNGTASVNLYELFADSASDLPTDPYYFSTDDAKYIISQGSIAWIISTSEMYIFNSQGSWVLQTP